MDRVGNSTFPPCIWLLRGFCLELYPYCLIRGHGIAFFSNQDFSAKGVVKGLCVWGVAPETTPEAEKSNRTRIRIYGFLQLAKITTLFPDWWRSLK